MKSSRCMGSSLASAARGPLLSVGQDHLAHRGDAVALKEHVLGAAQADALGAEVRRSGIGGGFRVGAHAHACAYLVGPFHDLAEIAGQLRLDHRDFARSTSPVEPSMVMTSPSLITSARP
jgi:glycerol kinase